MNAAEDPIEVIDGYRIDTTTGEILGLVDEMPKSTGFVICDQASLDWAMSKMLDEEAAIHEIDNTAIVVQARAILENANAIKSERAKRLAWLHARFDTGIGEYVKPLLCGRSTKTWKTLFGSVSFRTKPGGLRVLDEDKAIEIARNLFPHALKVTEAFRISQLTPEDVVLLTDEVLLDGDSPNYIVRGAFTVQEDSESITVKTSVTA